MDDIIVQLQKIFRRVLRQPQLALSREMGAQDVDGWDSLAHINLVIAMEKEFKVRFKTADIVGLKNIGEMADLISFRQQRDSQKTRPAFTASIQSTSEIRFNRDGTDDEELTVVKIYAAAGTHVLANESVFDVENSKATQEVVAPAEGILAYAFAVGDKLPFGRTVARIMPSEASHTSLAVTIDEMRSVNPTPVTPSEPTQTAYSTRANKKKIVERATGTTGSSAIATVLPRKREEIRLLSAGAGNTMLSGIGVRLGRMEISRDPDDFFADKILDLVAFEAARLMRKHPKLNASYRDGAVELHSAVNAGIAFDEGERLVVYGIADTDKKDLPAVRAEIEDALVRYIERKLTSSEVSRATFAITDLSSLNMDYIFPILPEGQSCIIGITRNAAREFALHVGFDHRVTEGLQVAIFLDELRDRLISFARKNCTVPHCSFCDKPADEEVGSFHGRGLVKVMDARGAELLACHSCWSGW